MLKKLYDWMVRQVDSPYAQSTLGILFFLEAIFFVPVDPLLVMFCIERRGKAFWYAGIATAASTLGGIAAYFIGFAVWETVGKILVNWATTPEKFSQLSAWFERYESWAVLFAGITPFPFKVVTLSAGFFKLPLAPFILFSCIARGIRFFAVAGFLWLWGHKVKQYIDRWFYGFVLLFVGICVLGVVLVK